MNPVEVQRARRTVHPPESEVGESAPRRKSTSLRTCRTLRMWASCAAVYSLAICLSGCLKSAKPAVIPPPSKVLYVTPTLDDVTEYEEFAGRTAAEETIELKARVSGYLDKISFIDGTDVTAGQVLFKIDDRPFVAVVKRTEATVKQYEARIKRLTSQARRSRSLYEKQAVSQDEFESIQYELDEAEATLAASQAELEVAKLNLEYTTIVAPIRGRIGRRMVDVGNLVIADQSSLATIVPLDRVYVYFDMDERTVLKLRRLEHEGKITSVMQEDLFVEIALADSDHSTLRGKIDFLDNQIDPATGTLRVRGTVANPDGLLSPGLFVRLRYPMGKPERSWMVPEESLASDQGRPFLYVINDKNMVETRSVELGPQMGQLRVIRSGIVPGDRVAVTGLQRLRAKMVVSPEPFSVPSVAEKPSEDVAADEERANAKTARGLGGSG